LFDILFEDEHMLVVNKPSGVLSQPNNNKDPDILDIIANMGIKLIGGEDPNRYGLVHRLDKDTSGVLILSKSEESYQKLQDEFRLRKVGKCYHFVATGQVKKMEFTSNFPLGRNPKKRYARMVDETGRDAETFFKLQKLYGKKYSLWEARPKTGRTHQIRVHAAEAGLSIIGDPLYAKNNQYHGLNSKEIKHTMLHCKSISISHPVTRKTLTFEAPYSSDFKDIIEKVSSL
jgi:23S rRNA pseudouridine1911/1915/1917 synthase